MRNRARAMTEPSSSSKRNEQAINDVHRDIIMTADVHQHSIMVVKSAIWAFRNGDLSVHRRGELGEGLPYGHSRRRFQPPDSHLESRWEGAGCGVGEERTSQGPIVAWTCAGGASTSTPGRWMPSVPTAFVRLSSTGGCLSWIWEFPVPQEISIPSPLLGRPDLRARTTMPSMFLLDNHTQIVTLVGALYVRPDSKNNISIKTFLGWAARGQFPMAELRVRMSPQLV